MRELGRRELENIATGASVLGSGGGGGSELGQTLIRLIIEKNPEGVKLIGLDELNPEDWGAVVAEIGAPSAAQDIKVLNSSTQAFEVLSDILRQQFSFVLPVEIGENTLIAALTATLKNLPLIDGDGCGRSVPKMEMTTYAASGVSIAPTVLASEKNPEVTTALYARNASEMEALVRPIISTDQFGAMAGLATWAMNSQTLRDQQILLPNTVTFAEEIGITLRRARESKQDPIKALLAFLNQKQRDAVVLFHGIIADAQEQSQGGFDGGVVTLKRD